MAKFLILSMLVAFSQAAPSQYGLHGVHAAVAVSPGHTIVHEQVHAGPAIARTQVHHGVVGSRTVQVGARQVLAGYNTYEAGRSLTPRQSYTYVASPATSHQETRPIAPPAIPAPAQPIIPGPARNYGYAPADAVTQQVVPAPVRTHTVVTPQIQRVVPEIQVNRYPVEVPVAVPTPVIREVVNTRHVQRPYNVEVPQPYVVQVPRVYNPVHQVVETPVIQRNTVSVHQPHVNVNTHVHHQQGYAQQGYAQQGYAHASLPVQTAY